jgi:hypothetical protein
MGRLIRVMEKDGVTWAYDRDTKKVKKLIIQDVPPSQVDPDFVEALIDIAESGREPEEGLSDPKKAD